MFSDQTLYEVQAYGDLVWISFIVEFIIGLAAWNPNFTLVEIVHVGSVAPHLVGSNAALESLTDQLASSIALCRQLQVGQCFTLNMDFPMFNDEGIPVAPSVSVEGSATTTFTGRISGPHTLVPLKLSTRVASATCVPEHQPNSGTPDMEGSCTLLLSTVCSPKRSASPSEYWVNSPLAGCGTQQGLLDRLSSKAAEAFAKVAMQPATPMPSLTSTTSTQLLTARMVQTPTMLLAQVCTASSVQIPAPHSTPVPHITVQAHDSLPVQVSDERIVPLQGTTPTGTSTLDASAPSWAIPSPPRVPPAVVVPTSIALAPQLSAFSTMPKARCISQ
ncbi:hypothetical protein PYCCODRAFT_1427803 [Trametes coccinea BRFM310]|uniref:Uncharacterized protein n=1 Tax=Trametes coccinea (strain BRFM310) TaxID=1353009 RepID=A0A1Y2IDU2_TRAC3|nr:hypothetical protein PYCCODRAFT_1427803 [Trametes coccinea BRFM310]